MSVAEIAYQAFREALPGEPFPPWVDLGKAFQLAWTAAALAAVRAMEQK